MVCASPSPSGGGPIWRAASPPGSGIIVLDFVEGKEVEALLRRATAFAGDPDIAATIVAEKVRYVLRCVRDGRGPAEADREHFPWFMWMIVRQSCRKALGQRGKGLRLLELDADPVSREQEPVEAIENRDTVEHLLKQLDDDERTAVELRIFGELTLSEAAAAMGLRDSTYRSMYYRALGKMRAMVSD